MFFKRIIFLLILSFSCPTLAGLIEESTCLKEMKSYYPYLKSGQLSLEKQERFFRCVHDFLELIVVNKFFTHDPSRDHFTKAEIFKMFHVYFKLEEDFSHEIVDKLFLVKHLIVGGEIDQLSDEGLKNLYELVNTYKDVYYILHKRIAVLQKILNPEQREDVSEEEFQFTLSKLKEAFKFLNLSYQEKGVSYRVSDFNHLLTYLESYNKGDSSWKNYSQFLKLWISGFLSEKNYIEGESWQNFFLSSHELASMFLHYKRYLFASPISQPKTLSQILKNLEYFVSALSFVEISEDKRGFPIENIDQMLFLMGSLSEDQLKFSDEFHIFTKQGTNPIPLFTRSLACFVFKTERSQSCSYKLGEKNFLSIKYDFPDGTFQFYRDRQQWIPKEGVTFEFTPSQLQLVKQWLSEYVEGYELLSKGQTEQVSHFYELDGWMQSSFGEMEEDSRIVFYPFFSSVDRHNSYRFLNYRFLSRLFLSPYRENQESYELTPEKWNRVVDEVFPVLLAFQKEGYDLSLRKQFLNLFDYTDNFLNSSNGDGSLNQKEVLDLIVHVMSAIENSNYAYNKIIRSCSNVSCVADRLFGKDIMKPFPRLQSYLSNYGAKNYKSSTQNLLKSRTPLSKSSDLIDVFLMIQMLEVQFQLMDKNENVRMESQEIFRLIKRFSDRLVFTIPYIKNISQSYSFVMFSFKTGHIPFLDEGDRIFHSLQFFDWHNYHRGENFDISKGELYSTTLKFYKLYQDYL